MTTRPYNHPLYDQVLARAATRAFNERAEMAVYFDGENIYVRDAKAARPAGSTLVCIASRWDNKTIQLRFAGAYSEFRNI